MTRSSILYCLICSMTLFYSSPGVAGIDWETAKVTVEEQEIAALHPDGNFLVSWKDDTNIPSQGWKIHVSADTELDGEKLTQDALKNLDIIAEAVIPTLKRHDIAYKVAIPDALATWQSDFEKVCKGKQSDTVAFILDNKKIRSLSQFKKEINDEHVFNKIFQPGKFITIYPKSLQEAADILMGLNEKDGLVKLAGKARFSHLIGDLEFGTSGGLFVRYGAMAIGGNHSYAHKGSNNTIYSAKFATHVKEISENNREKFIIAQGEEDVEIYTGNLSSYEDRREYPFPAFILETQAQQQSIRKLFKGGKISWRGQNALADIIESMKKLNNSPSVSEHGSQGMGNDPSSESDGEQEMSLLESDISKLDKDLVLLKAKYEAIRRRQERRNAPGTVQQRVVSRESSSSRQEKENVSSSGSSNDSITQLGKKYEQPSSSKGLKGQQKELEREIRQLRNDIKEIDKKHKKLQETKKPLPSKVEFLQQWDKIERQDQD